MLGTSLQSWNEPSDSPGRVEGRLIFLEFGRLKKTPSASACRSYFSAVAANRCAIRARIDNRPGLLGTSARMSHAAIGVWFHGTSSFTKKRGQPLCMAFFHVGDGLPWPPWRLPATGRSIYGLTNLQELVTFDSNRTVTSTDARGLQHCGRNPAEHRRAAGDRRALRAQQSE